MGVPQARLLPATASEKSACAAAGAISDSSPRTAASPAQPQMARSGMKPNFCEMGRKKDEKGRAPSREKAQLCRLAATMMDLDGVLGVEFSRPGGFR